MTRKRFSDMSIAELEEMDKTNMYRTDRAKKFYNGDPETVLEYWECDEPDDFELRAIIKNMLTRMQRL